MIALVFLCLGEGRVEPGPMCEEAGGAADFEDTSAVNAAPLLSRAADLATVAGVVGRLSCVLGLADGRRGGSRREGLITSVEEEADFAGET